MKKFLLGTALVLGAILGATLGFGGGVPLLPSVPQYSEASQIIGTLNAFINQLNGNPAGSGGFAAQPNGVVSLGSFCTSTGASPTSGNCNAQRGVATFTAVGTLTTGATTSLGIPNTNMTTASVCQVTIGQQTGAAGGSAVVPSYTVPSSGGLNVTVVNAGTTATGAITSLGIYFNCIN